ncbi:MAG: esterase-like activity of phytase family protein, partial [Brevundimonas sp.]|nr:esterase-like activity of phytase family protein [Brevundimonas sp.]
MTAFLGACASAPFQSGQAQPSPGASYCANLSARLMSVGTVTSQLEHPPDTIGGLSGIEFDSTRDRYLLVTDDRGQNGGGRIYTASMVSGPGSAPVLQIDHALSIVTAPTGGRPSPAVDVESVRLFGRHRVIWSSEGDEAAGISPGIYRATRGNGVGTALPLPSQLSPRPGLSEGPRPNRSFEGLAKGFRVGHYYAALEAPLAETDAMPSLASGGVAPIFEIDERGHLHAQFLYPLEPIARHLPGRLADNGVSEILAPKQDTFLVLERSGSQQDDGSFRFVSRLYCAWAPQRDADPKNTIELRKRLVFDFMSA